MHKTYLLLVSLLMLLSCSKFQKAQKSTNPEEKYAKAVEYYNKGDFYKAGVLLDELMPMLKGTKNAEEAQLKYSYCQYNSHQYYLANYYFNKFYETYPTSEFSEEALFMAAKSSYMNSPEVKLDQTTTQETLDAFQNFIVKYPNSKFKEEATQMIDNARGKLELKLYNQALLYYKIEEYKAANVTFDNFKNGFPESSRNEYISYLKIKNQYNYAAESVESKKLERYNVAIEFYQDFVDKYPQSKYLKDAESIYDNISNKLKELNKLQNKNG
ncbi:MAG: outer membrane protein assembly factor BamD [Cytophagales bacterium]